MNKVGSSLYPGAQFEILLSNFLVRKKKYYLSFYLLNKIYGNSLPHKSLTFQGNLCLLMENKRTSSVYLIIISYIYFILKVICMFYYNSQYISLGKSKESLRFLQIEYQIKSRSCLIPRLISQSIHPLPPNRYCLDGYG